MWQAISCIFSGQGADVCSPLLSANHGKEEEVRGAKVRCRGGEAGRRCRIVDETFFWRSKGVARTECRLAGETFFWTSLCREGGVWRGCRGGGAGSFCGLSCAGGWGTLRSTMYVQLNMHELCFQQDHTGLCYTSVSKTVTVTGPSKRTQDNITRRFASCCVGLQSSLTCVPKK